MADCCARPGSGIQEGPLARRDYRCGACREAFSLDDQPPAALVVCPACGSSLVHELWESRVRSLGETPPGRLEELRDRPG